MQGRTPLEAKSKTMNHIGQDIIPNIQFDSSGKLSADSEARACIMSLPAGDLVTQLEQLEGEYERFMYGYKRKFFTDAGFATTPRLRGKLAWKIAGLPLSLFRRQFAAIARALQSELASKAAQGVELSIKTEYYKLVEEKRLLRVFVEANFEGHMRRAEAEGKPVFDLVKELLLKAKG